MAAKISYRFKKNKSPSPIEENITGLKESNHESCKGIQQVR